MNLKPLVDGDILLYEIGYGAETGWRSITGDESAIPPWSYVEHMLHQRLDNICAVVDTNETPSVYITEGRTFRYDIAVTKPYKDTRIETKPWHWSNLKAYMKGALDAIVVTHLEADDQMAIDSTSSNGTAIICSRDKDLRQVPGWYMAWELGNQPQIGPIEISTLGTLSYDEDRTKLSGNGFAWFSAQTLMGDSTDNIPGLARVGPKKAYDLLRDRTDYLEVLKEAYEKHHKEEYEKHLLEQGQLCWIVRRLKGDGTPELWYPGLEA